MPHCLICSHWEPLHDKAGFVGQIKSAGASSYGLILDFEQEARRCPPTHTRHVVTDTNETATLPHKAQSGIS